MLDFNPWMFSGSEHLVEAFFSELTAHVRLKLDLDDIGKLLDKYGDYLFAAPFVGSWAARLKLLLGMAGSWRRPHRSQIEVTRDKIREALAQQRQPLIVVLDDLDRLTAEEVRDIFRLVRLTASFPNIVYVLTFDRHQVEAALEETGQAGRAYLEKIVQLVFDLSEIPDEVLLDELTSAIDESLSGIDGLEPFDDHMRDVWASVLYRVIMPLMRNLRDVRRYCLSIRGTVIDQAGEICLPDLLALEAIRIFLPDVFMQLRGAVDTVTSPLQARVEDAGAAEAARQRVDEIVDSGSSQRGVVEALFEHIFPEGGRHLRDVVVFAAPHEWYQQRRVANTEIFRLYLERSEGQALGLQRQGDQALSLLADAVGLRSHLQSLEPESLRHVIASLETHQSHFRPAQVIPGVTVLLNTWPTMAKHQGGFFDLDNRFVVSRVVLRLLEAWAPREEVHVAVDEILPQLETLSAQLELITIVGHKESAGHQLVSAQHAERIESAFRSRVRNATADALANEHDLLSVMYRTKTDASPSEPELVVPADPRVTRAMLEASQHEVRTTSVGGGEVWFTPHLHWDTLVEVYGDEVVLSERLAELRTQHPEGLTNLLELADRYASGWRPPEWPERDRR